MMALFEQCKPLHFSICKSMLCVPEDMQSLQASLECFASNRAEMLLQSPHFTAVIEGKIV